MTEDIQQEGMGSPVVLTEAVGIQAALQARDRLVAALGTTSELVIDCSGVNEADIGIVQVLIAAKRSATARGGGVRFVPGPTAALLAAFERAGVGFDDY